MKMLQNLNNINIKVSTLNLVACLFFIVFCNYSFWQQCFVAYPLNSHTIPFLIALALVLFCFYYLVLTLLSFRYILKPILVVLFVLAAVSAYAMDTFGYVISSYSFVNLTETDSHEIHELLTLKLGLYISLLAVLPTLMLFFCKINYHSYKTKILHVVIVCLLLAGNLAIYNKSYVTFIRNHKEIRYYINPMRPVYSLVKFVSRGFSNQSTKPFTILDEDPVIVRLDQKPKLIILVVGESDRAVNHSLNGYERATNPLLSKRVNLINFTQASSCGTETTVSVPCMFSSFERVNFTYEKGRYTENVLDILHKAKVQVLWRDNDMGCKNVCDRIPTEDLNNALIEPFCTTAECHDEVLLHNLQDHISNNVGDKLIVLHKKGNHGPAYAKRYPAQFEVFTPTCQSNNLEDCSTEEIVNAYDNIVVYTDYFLDKVIEILEANQDQYQTAMLYVSDHGESLGEHGIYLHAMPYWLAPKEQTHIPFMMWTSKDFAVNQQQLLANKDQPISHDHLYHTLLGMFAVRSTTYNNELDICSG